MAEKIKIGGELDPRTPEKILGDASTIKDRTWAENHPSVAQTPNQKQDEINEYFQDQIDNIVATEQGGIQTDAAPTEGSVKLVQSGGTYASIESAKTFSTGEKVPNVGIDSKPTAGSNNLIASGGIIAATVKNQNYYTISNYFYLASTGAYTSLVGAFSTPHIPISTERHIELYTYLGGSTYVNYGIAFFDANYDFVSSYLGTSAGMQVVVLTGAEIPATAVYFTAMLPNGNNLDKAYIYNGFGAVQLKTNAYLEDKAKKEASAAQQYTVGISNMSLLIGSIETTTIIWSPEYKDKYVVIKVNGEDSVVIGASVSGAKIAILSDFDAPKTFPYNLVFATGETATRYVQSGYTATLPSDAKYIIMRASSKNVDSFLPSTFKINGYEIATDIVHKLSSINTQINSINEHLSVNDTNIENLEDKFKYQELVNSFYSVEGYYRVNVSPIIFSHQSGFKITNLIPISTGDIIFTNTSIPGTSTAGHVLFNGNASSADDTSNILGTIIPDAQGKFTITQEMYNNGARYIGISFKLEDTPTPFVRKQQELILSEMHDDIQKNAEDIKELQDKIVVQRLSDKSFDVVTPKNGKAIKYRFVKYEKTFDAITYLDENNQEQTATNVVGADVWNNEEIYDGNDTYLMQGNTNFIFKEHNVTRHTGNGHGCEVSLYTQFFADGKEVNPLTDTIVCEVFRFIWKANVYKSSGTGNSYTNNEPALDIDGNPIINAVHLLDGKIDKNGVHIDNSLTFKRDGITLDQCHGAMFEVNYGDFEKIIINTGDKTINEFSASGICTPIAGSMNLLNNPNNKANIVEFYGDKFFAKQSMYPMRGCQIDNFVIGSYDYPNSRLKNYFMPIGCYHFSPDAGVNVQTLNNGDVVSVKCEREIELF